jgi:hypothetical protein
MLHSAAVWRNFPQYHTGPWTIVLRLIKYLSVLFTRGASPLLIPLAHRRRLCALFHNHRFESWTHQQRFSRPAVILPALVPQTPYPALAPRPTLSPSIAVVPYRNDRGRTIAPDPFPCHRIDCSAWPPNNQTFNTSLRQLPYQIHRWVSNCSGSLLNTPRRLKDSLSP